MSEYTFTEIISFQFKHAAPLTSSNPQDTGGDSAWEDSLRTYLQLEGTGIVWWALVHGAPDQAKLIVDWKSVSSRDNFVDSSDFQRLSASWQSLTQAMQSDIYCLPPAETYREVGFSRGHETVSVLFTFTFNTSIPSGSDGEKRWNDAHDRFSWSVLKSPGGVVASGFTGGWQLDRGAYLAAFRYASIEKMQSFIAHEKPLEELQVMATGGIDVEFIETRVYKHGWLGAVDKTEPEYPRTAAFFAAIGAPP